MKLQTLLYCAQRSNETNEENSFEVFERVTSEQSKIPDSTITSGAYAASVIASNHAENEGSQTESTITIGPSVSIQDSSRCNEEEYSQNVRSDELNENTNLEERPETETYRKEKSSETTVEPRRGNAPKSTGYIQNSSSKSTTSRGISLSDTRIQPCVGSLHVGANQSTSLNGAIDARHRIIQRESVLSRSPLAVGRGGLRGVNTNYRPVRGIRVSGPCHNADQPTHSSAQGQPLVRIIRDQRIRGGGRGGGTDRVRNVSRIHHMALFYCIFVLRKG